MKRKMLGRLGWHGQCACCSGPRDRCSIKNDEERQWREESVLETMMNCPVCGVEGEGPYAPERCEACGWNTKDSCPDCGAEIRVKTMREGGGVVCSAGCGYWFCY